MSSPQRQRDVEPFWLCHECGAQMRPIRTRGIPQCASCEGEFIEILDPSVNPDPFHDLPPPPPIRPTSAPSSTSPTRSIPSQYQQQAHQHTSRPNSPQSQSQFGNEHGGLMSSILSGLFGGLSDHDDSHQTNDSNNNNRNTNTNTGNGFGDFGFASPDPPPQPRSPTGSGRSGSGSGSGVRTFQFNFPGGGAGSFTIGSFGGGGGFGGSSGDQGGGLDSFFPGFPPAQGGRGTAGSPFGNSGGSRAPFGGRDPFAGMRQGRQPGNPMDQTDLMRALMSIISEDLGPEGPQMMMFGPGMNNGNFGDYVMTQQGFDEVLERLMQAAGPQGPLPAPDVVIEGLPRFKLDDKKLEQSPFKDCPVCKDDFVVDDEVMRIPCTHIFHVDCLQPWLKTNGSCPVCRFSLVPDESNRTAQQSDTQAGVTNTNSTSSGPTSPGAEGVGSTVTNILQRLWGQSGSTSSNPTSPNEETHPQMSMGQGSEAATTTTSNIPSTSNSTGQNFAPPPGPPPSQQRQTPTSGSSNRVHTQSPYDIFQSAFNPPRGTSSPSPVPPRPYESTPFGLGNNSHSGQNQSGPGPQSPGLTDRVQPSTAIPDDYRERHRRKEEQAKEEPFVDDLD